MSSVCKSGGAGSRPANLKSGVWEHFVRDSDKQSAQCKICKASLKIGGGSTKSLHSHLQTKHAINVLKGKPSGSGSDQEGNGANNGRPTEMVKPNMHKNRRPTLASDSLMEKYILKPNDSSLSATVARLTACDGLSFNVFSKSNDLRRVFAAAGYIDIPKSANGIRALVSEHGQAVRSYVMAELAQCKAKGQKFSITFDEWTSTRNRRYMIVNVHEQGPKFWSLGLVRVYGSMPAEKCIELLEAKLATFGLSLSKDIVAICTDGASVMCKVGRLLEAEQQLCYAHGIQLAVLDVLYKNKSNKRMDLDHAGDDGHRQACDGDGDAEVDDNQLLESDKNQTEGEEDSEEPEGELSVDLCLEVEEIQDDIYTVLELSDDYRDVILKVRKVVKIFRKSPTKNDAVLQKYVLQEHGKDLSLMLDCPTRWNSLLAMLSRFKQLASCVQKALIDLNLSNEVTQADFAVINEMVAALQPVALAVEAICRRDVNLIAAEAAIQFCIAELRRQSSELAYRMAASLQQRMHERSAIHSGVLHYLHNRHESSLLSPVPQASVIRQLIQRLVTRLDQVYEGRSKDELIRSYAIVIVNYCVLCCLITDSIFLLCYAVS
jgi:BED zinc finger